VAGRVAGRVAGVRLVLAGAGDDGPALAGVVAQPAPAIDNIPVTANNTQLFMASSRRFIE
jgi:hypothetical protein